MMNALSKLHTKLVGPIDTTSIQARIFHEVCIMGILALPVSFIVNLFVGVPYLNVMLITVFCAICLFYYNSRHRNNLDLSVQMFTFFTNLVLPINYFFNAGIAGPTLLLSLLSVVFTVAVMPRRKALIWITLSLVSMSVMFYIDYANPDLIKNSYPDRAGLFMDLLSSYLATIVCVIVVLSYLIKSQQSENIKAVEASNALKTANDSKTKLLSILSHDLRSPLSSIQGFLEILVEFDLEEGERKAIKKKLLKETKGTQEMLFNLLSWTKSQMEGGVKVNLIAVNLYQIIESCIDIQRAAAFEKNISISNKVDRKVFVKADVDMLKLVVRNLLNNAIKFTNSGGEISTSSEVTGITGTLIIADNGIGIAESKAASIFTLKSESTYGTNNEKGVGLGLLLCKEFTELQHGKITLTTSPNTGTSFSLQFPLIPEDSINSLEINSKCVDSQPVA
jgi:two-component system sensor histidine kinase/response regulator